MLLMLVLICDEDGLLLSINSFHFLYAYLYVLNLYLGSDLRSNHVFCLQWLCRGFLQRQPPAPGGLADHLSQR